MGKARSWESKKPERKFEGKTYHRITTQETKTFAKGRAKDLREDGYRIRITKEKLIGKPGMLAGNPKATSTQVYVLWGRKKTR